MIIRDFRDEKDERKAFFYFKGRPILGWVSVKGSPTHSSNTGGRKVDGDRKEAGQWIK
jgi:hypothetical protein